MCAQSPTSISNRKAYEFISMDNDGVASINIRLELAGVGGMVRWAGSIYNLHKKGGLVGECRPPLRCLSQFLSYERERDQLLMVL